MRPSREDMALKPRSGDFVLIGLFVLLGVFLLLMFTTRTGRGGTVVISQEGTVLWRVPLDVDGQWAVSGVCRNVICVREGAVFVSEATCPDQDCVRMGPVSKPGQVIACLPNRLLIRVEGEGDVDAVSG